jgi:hypothetical protein
MATNLEQPLTLAAAQALHDEAAARGTPPVWFVSDADPAYPGKVTARAFTKDHHGGAQLHGALVADTLDELRAMMPAGLTVQEPAPVHPPDVIETWD